MIGREAKELIECKEYKERELVWKARFERETELTNKGKVYVETVVFEANNRGDLEHNHSRYFKSFEGVIKKFIQIKKDFKKSGNY